MEDKKEELKKVVKFAVSGGMNTIVDVGVYWVLAVALGANIFFAQFCGYTAGMLNSYLINRKWTFKTEHQFFSMQLVKFLLTNLVILGISMLLIQWLTVYFGLDKLIAKLITTCFTIGVSFLISRFWVFKS